MLQLWVIRAPQSILYHVKYRFMAGRSPGTGSQLEWSKSAAGWRELGPAAKMEQQHRMEGYQMAMGWTKLGLETRVERATIPREPVEFQPEPVVRGPLRLEIIQQLPRRSAERGTPPAVNAAQLPVRSESLENAVR